MRILMSGVNGRMGHAVVREAQRMDAEIVCGVDPTGGDFPFPVYSDFSGIQESADVLIDFSRADALPGLLEYALAKQIPCVLCSTGYTEDQLQMISRASESIPVFRSANMSLGIAVLRKLSTMAAQMLGEEFDIEIVEAHHNQKMDAPSGTAIMLYDAVNAGLAEPRTRKDGRSGMGKREKQEIGMAALRGGTVAGEHAVCFFGPMERVELRHSAEDRSVFAIGALRAARFMVGQKPGIYNMDQVIGL